MADYTSQELHQAERAMARDVALMTGATMAVIHSTLSQGGAFGFHFGPFADAPLYTPLVCGITSATLSAIWAAGTYRIIRYARSWAIRTHEDVAPASADDYEMPPKPEFEEQFAFVLGEMHSGYAFDYETFGVGRRETYWTVGNPNHPLHYSENPKWVAIPWKALCTGMLVLGAVGSAKSAGIARSFLQQIIGWNPKRDHLKCAALIADPKTEIVNASIQEAVNVGRQEDVYPIGPGRDVFWNPVFEPGLDISGVVMRLMTALEAISLSKPDANNGWIFDNGRRTFEGCAGLLQMSKPHGYFTLKDMATLLDECAAVAGPAGEDGDAYPAVIQQLNKHAPADLTEEARPTWYYYLDCIAQLYRLAPKNRNIATNQMETLLGFFRKPSIARLYCPDYETIQRVGFKGFPWAFQEGKLVMVDAPIGLFGNASVALTMFLKQGFQRAALDRVPLWQRDPSANKTRPLVLFLDEYQNYVSSSGLASDEAFFAESRASLVVAMLITPSRSGLIKKIGQEATSQLLGNLRTKMILAQMEPEDRHYAADLCGKEWRKIETKTVSGTAEDARLSGEGTYMARGKTSVSESIAIKDEERYRFDPSFFRDIPAFSCVLDTFDGTAAIPPALVRLTGYWDTESANQLEFMENLKRGEAEKAFTRMPSPTELAIVTEIKDVPVDTGGDKSFDQVSQDKLNQKLKSKGVLDITPADVLASGIKSSPSTGID